MSKKDFFPVRPETSPSIYAYKLEGVQTHHGWIKIGYTDRDAQTRIREQLGTAAIPYRILLEQSAMRSDGSAFSDHEIHRNLHKKGIQNPEGEWFVCMENEVLQSIHEVRTGQKNRSKPCS